MAINFGFGSCPSPGVPLDQSHPLFRGASAVACWTGENPENRNGTTNSLSKAGTTGNSLFTPVGLKISGSDGALSAGSNAGFPWSDQSIRPFAQTTPFTTAMVFTPSAFNGSAGLIFGNEINGSGWGVFVRSTGVIVMNDWGGLDAESSSGLVVPSRTYVIVHTLTHPSGWSFTLHLNGTQAISGTPTGNHPELTNYIGSSNGYLGAQPGFFSLFLMVQGRQWSIAEIADFSSNPWQIFQSLVVPSIFTSPPPALVATASPLLMAM